jgi:hypothetical protein
MKTTVRPAALSLAVLLAAAAPAAPRIGFVDLAQLVAAHPLHPVLAQYEREIAALRSTEDLPRLTGVGARARASALAVRADASAATFQAGRIAAATAAQSRSEERSALATVLASQHASATGAAYTSELIRATNAGLAAYQRSIAQRNERAYAAREQQLREKESTLAFDLARADAGKRLVLRVKLAELHLSGAARASLRAQLAALDARELQAVRVQQRNDAAALAAYQSELQRDGSDAVGAMAAQVRAIAAANLATDRQILRARSSLAPMLPDQPARARAFEASFAPMENAQAVAQGFNTAGYGLALRFTALGSAAEASQRGAAAQIARLEADRSALYRAIVAQIVREAQTLARERHLDRIDLTGSPPKGSLDLTAQTRRVILSGAP